jgi:hypothetical protein
MTPAQRKKIKNMSPTEFRNFKRKNDIADDVTINTILMGSYMNFDFGHSDSGYSSFGEGDSGGGGSTSSWDGGSSSSDSSSGSDCGSCGGE